MGDVLKKFGRYFLLDQIAQGGMAEIYRARLAAVDGAGRLLVIKRIQSGFGTNSEFLQMFKSEIKVTMGFNHPNIVQLYDFGEENQQPYIAMELVDGKNLRQFISRFAELRQPFPVELAAYVIEQAACGLQYAHAFKDKISGQHLNIVHRDISPQNVLISYEGTIKVIDFGIAKAESNVESTRAGVIKGKPSYLSPEQISGETLDGRSDIFSLGAVLWEVLTGKKLFAGENDLAVLKLIESCQQHVKPPSTLNPKVPKELDYIVLKSLAKQREKRYQTAEEFQRALHKFLYSYMSEFNPADLGYYAKDLFKNEIVDDRKRVQRLNDEVERLLSVSLVTDKSMGSVTGTGTKKVEESTMVDGGVRRGLDLVVTENTKQPKLEVENVAPGAGAARSSAPKFPSASGARPAPVNPGATRASAPMAAPASTRSFPQQRSKELRVPSQGSGGAGKMLFLSAAAVAAVAVFGPEFGIRIPVLTEQAEQLLGREAKLVLQGSDKNVTVIVNGKAVAKSLPATLKGVPVGTPFRVRVLGESGAFEQDVTVASGERKEINVAFTGAQRAVGSVGSAGAGSIMPSGGESAPAGKGTIMLRLNITPGGGRPVVTISGKPVNVDNPVIAVPLDAPLELVAERQGFRSLKREFVLEGRSMGGLKETLMDVQMEPLQFGFLTVHTTPSADATIMLDGRPWIKKTPLDHEKLPIGTYQIKLANEVLGMEKLVTVTVHEGKVVNIDERLEIKD